MRLIQYPDLVSVAGWPIACGIAQFADFIDATIGGGIDLDHVHRIACPDLEAGVAHAARLRNGMVCRATVQRHGQDARDGGFADAPMSAEDVTMRDALLLNGVLQGTGDVLLTDDVGELLGSIFARQNLVTHGRKFRLYGLRLWNGRTPG